MGWEASYWWIFKKKLRIFLPPREESGKSCKKKENYCYSPFRGGCENGKREGENGRRKKKVCEGLGRKQSGKSGKKIETTVG